jgi:hypothetical protein
VAITAKAGEARKLVPAGRYFGIVVGVYDLGTQPSKQYDPTHKVLIQFELHRKAGPVRGDDNRPLTISGFYPLNFGKRKDGTKSKLRQVVEGILGRSFNDDEAKSGYDITQLVDMGCRLSITHETRDGSTYDTIDTVMPLDEDDPKLSPELSAIVYELDTRSPIPDDVPDWIGNMVKRSIEWVKVYGSSDAKGGDDGGNRTRQRTTPAAVPPAPPAPSAAGDDDIPF